jgi:predicted NUDIX family NTP pyrophosphohydrolase
MPKMSAGILLFRFKNMYPEMDRGLWYTIEEAKVKILAAQLPFIEELEKMI